MKYLIAALALGIAVPKVAAAQSAASTPEAHDADIALATSRGKMIYDYDQAAWHSTDALLEDVKDARALGIQGWVVTKVAAGLDVTYFGRNDQGPYGIYSAVWTGTATIDRKRIAPGAAAVLQPEQLRLIAAREAASPVGLLTCSNKPFNTVVLPAEKPGNPDLVYYLTPQISANSIPFGGHHRIAILNGKETGRRSFTRGCMELPLPTGKKRKKLAALMVTHLLDPIPTEAHVFNVFASQVPLYVGTQSNGQLWSVESVNGEVRIRLLPPPKK